jgi:hypothetical protein
MNLPKICTCPTVPAEDCPFHHKAWEDASDKDWDSRTISIARYYGHGDSTELAEDGRVRPALVLEKAIAVAIDAWADGTAVTIQLCPEEVEQWVALVCVHGHDVTAFSIDETGPLEERQVQEVWLSSDVLTALDHARQNHAPKIPPNSQLPPSPCQDLSSNHNSESVRSPSPSNPRCSKSPKPTRTSKESL